MTVIEFATLNVGLVVCRVCHVAVPEDRTEGHAEWHADQEQLAETLHVEQDRLAETLLGRLVEVGTMASLAPVQTYVDPDDSGSAFSAIEQQRVDLTAYAARIGLQIETHAIGQVRVRFDGELNDILDALALFNGKHIHLDNLTPPMARPGGGVFVQGEIDVAEWRRFAVAHEHADRGVEPNKVDEVDRA